MLRRSIRLVTPKTRKSLRCSVSRGALWYVFKAFNGFSRADIEQDAEWHDPQVEAEMNELLRLRDLVNVLLEKPRRNKYDKQAILMSVGLTMT